MERNESIFYDGTNAQHIANEWLVGATIVSEDESALILEIHGWPPMQFTVARNSYVVRYWDRNFRESLTPEMYAQRWVEIPESAAPSA
jgi:hypothetical protein